MWVRVVVAIALLVLPAAAFAQTEKRIALVIGNKDYKAGGCAHESAQRHPHSRPGAEGRRVALLLSA
jgi:hypothetical protein